MRRSPFADWVRTVRCGVCFSAVTLVLVLLMSSADFEDELQTESREMGFQKTEQEYRSTRDQFARQWILRGMFRMNPERAFDYITSALMTDSGCVQTEAAHLVAEYYLKVTGYPGDSDHVDEKFSETVMSARQATLERLRELSGSERIKSSIAALQSLIRMGEIDSVLVERLYSIALGEGKERWSYDCLECGVVHDKQDYDAHQQKDAVGVLLGLKRLGQFQETIEMDLQNILERVEMQSLEHPSPAYELMKKAIGNELDEAEDTGDCRSSVIYDDEWRPYDAVNYAVYWCDKRNSTETLTCDPYQDYQNRGGDCANFGSQCLWAGGFKACGGIGCDWCDADYCCTPSAEHLGFYLEGRGPPYVESWPVDWENPDEENPGDRAPFSFGPGDIVILYQVDRNGWRHTLINVGGYCNDAIYACHTVDQCAATLDGYIGSGWTQFQKAKFFHIIPRSSCQTWGCVKSVYDTGSYTSSSASVLSSYDNTLVWNVPPHDPADYLIFKATDSDGDDDFVRIGSRLRQDTCPFYLFHPQGITRLHSPPIA